MKLHINPRFERLLDPLTDEEARALRESLTEDGQLEPITIASIDGVPDTIVDGHNRYRLLTEMRKEPQIRVKVFESVDAAEEWIIRKQLGRRNLDKQRRKELVGRLYNARKQTKGGDRKSNAQNERLISDRENKGRDATAREVASDTGDSVSTVKRAGRYAESLDKLPDTLANALCKRPNVATERAVIKLASLPDAKHHEFARDLRTGKATSLDEWLGLKKKTAGKPAAAESTESASETPSASIVMDDLDRHVPTRLLKPHQDGQILAEFARAVSKAKSYGKNLLDGDDAIDGAAYLDVKQAMRNLDAIRREITQSIYYTDCPRCQGEVKADCKRCGGNGWIPRRDKGCLGEDELAYLGQR